MESPLHLAIIPDGNRRWAKPRGLKPWKGHEAAINVLQDVIEHCRKDDRIGQEENQLTERKLFDDYISKPIALPDLERIVLKHRITGTKKINAANLE